jgi:hypothetical protein
MKESEVERKYNDILKVVSSIVGDKTTYGSDLTKFGRDLFGQKYRGTFASNLVPTLKNGDYCIVNLDKSFEGGSHWVAVVHQSGNNYVYDSYGRPSKNILPDLRKVRDADYDQEQGLLEEDCGARCLSWLWFVERHGLTDALKL